MELRQLRYFVAVAEEQNFGRAARKLNISQPPITRQIKKLEDEMGVRLFKRTSKGTETTAAGQIFLEDAQAILARVNRSVERGQAAQRGELGALEIGYFGSTSYSVVPRILSLFKADNPGIELSLRRMSKKEQIEALKIGQLHIGFGRYYPSEPELAIEEVIAEGLALCLPRDFDGAIDDTNWTTIFDELPLVLFPSLGRPNFADETISILKREGVNPSVGAVAEDVRAALMLLAIGAGAMVVPNSVTDMNWFGVRFVKLKALADDCPVNIIYRKSDTSPQFRRFMRSIQKFRAASSEPVQSSAY
ncbi:LysR family transcriptional regulator [Parasphingopyxis algicola]|uniref:LysR family transcriptional regulator n=1 Tax=Parasphingopyxis algicola TaxID=2026624 RepID=UPI0015A00B2A|nr:LysR family transcriptional regulator [Parasphingopyxis algicola]QLC26418.1 LysR family transcriptional regulator [Parasphingopyxis algicola]